MKVMIDITPEELKTLEKIKTSIDHQTLVELSEKILEAHESWSDISISEISYYAPSDEKEKTVPLRKQLVFDPHTTMQVEQPGMYLAFPHTKMVMHRFEIGRDHSGVILMPYTSWMVLNQIPSTNAKVENIVDYQIKNSL